MFPLVAYYKKHAVYVKADYFKGHIDILFQNFLFQRPQEMGITDRFATVTVDVVIHHTVGIQTSVLIMISVGFVL